MSTGILVLYHGADPTGRAIEAHLRQTSVPVTAIDLADVPGRSDLTLEDGGIRLGSHDLGSVRLVVNRSRLNSFGSPSPQTLGERAFRTWYGRFLAEKERQAFLVSVLAALDAAGAQLLNPLEVSDLALMRPLVLDRLRRAGIPVAGPDVATPAEPFARAQLAPGDVLLRLFRLNGQTLAAGMLRPAAGQPLRYEAAPPVPGWVEHLLQAIERQLEARTAAVDLVLRDGTLRFWGWDPAPGFDEFETETGQPLAAPFAAALARSLA